MHQASVGFHCPDCARAGAQTIHRGIPSEVPWLTYGLIALNVAVFVVGIAFDGTQSIGGAIGEMHARFALAAKGMLRGELAGVGAGEWYRLVTSGFLHYGVVHLAMNMYVLYLLGRLLEPAGRGRMALIYTASLLMGSFGALILSPGSLTAGASGAVFGLMGAVFMGHRAMGVDWRNSPLLNVILLNLVITFALSRMISVGGHVGGLVGGGIAGWLLLDLARRPEVPDWLPQVLTIAVSMAAVAGSVWFASSWTG